jgi:monoamine oxidase
MINFIKKLFGGKPAEVTAEVPYKVEAEKCPVMSAPVVEVKTPVAVVKTPAAPKAPAKATAKKPAAKKAGGQKPKGPRKPKPAKAVK